MVRFLYYFLCLCKSFKELFLYLLSENRCSQKRVQRYGLFLNPPNLLIEKFNNLTVF